MNSVKKSKASQNLPAAMQKMLSAVKKPNVSLMQSKDSFSKMGLNDRRNSLS